MAANAEQVRDIEERVQSLGEVLASPVREQDDGEKARREDLRKCVLPFEGLVQISEPHRSFLGNWPGSLRSLGRYPKKTGL